MLVPATMHDGQNAVLVQPLEADHRWVEAEPFGDLDRVALADGQVRPGAIVARVAVRDDGVQAVVAARQLDDDENPFGMLLEAGACQRLCGQRRRRAVENERQRGADTDAVQAVREEVAPGTRASEIETSRTVGGHLASPRSIRVGIPAC